VDNKYHLDYNNTRYKRVISKLISILGGKCVKCGSTTDLQFDHKNPAEKEFTITVGWARNWNIVLQEARKCQLLCVSCHSEKSTIERGQLIGKGNHGTLASYRYCKCPECKEAKAQYNRQYKAAKLA
jgi:5-methylcytosine-specific restriction endonuclease McrA